MFDKLNKVVFTLLASALVVTLGWWTIFLRGKLTDHEAQFDGAQSEIGRLEGELQSSAEHAVQLGVDLAASEEEVLLREERIQEQKEYLAAAALELEASEAEVYTLSSALRLLKVSQRVARLEVLEREVTPEVTRTRLRFTELASDGSPLGEPVELTVEGTRIYVEALVIKFDDRYVEAGDFLRGTSVCIFQRIFGEHQQPDQGYVLEARNSKPGAYFGDAPVDPLYLELWEHFWDYAEDPAAARAKGVRALHGEAPFVEARPGKSYRIILRASGGLSITPE